MAGECSGDYVTSSAFWVIRRLNVQCPYRHPYDGGMECTNPNSASVECKSKFCSLKVSDIERREIDNFEAWFEETLNRGIEKDKYFLEKLS